jgi:hypothetical protein
MQMCSKVAVYGFGVNEVGGEKVSYHYYTGYAARKVTRPPAAHAGGHLRHARGGRQCVCGASEAGQMRASLCGWAVWQKTFDGIRFLSDVQRVPAARTPPVRSGERPHVARWR